LHQWRQKVEEREHPKLTDPEVVRRQQKLDDQQKFQRWIPILEQWDEHWSCNEKVSTGWSDLMDLRMRRENCMDTPLRFILRKFYSDPFTLDRGERLETAKSVPLVELWNGGLPPTLRKYLWPISVGNAQRIDPDLQRWIEYADDPPEAFEEDFGNQAWLNEAIAARDLGGTHDHSDHRTVEDVKMYVEEFVMGLLAMRTDITYVSGMVSLASMLCVEIPDPKLAFVTFLNLIHQFYFLDFFRMHPRSMKTRVDFFTINFVKHLPLLHDHFSTLQLTPNTFLITWFLNLFSNVLPYRTLTRVWDMIFLYGEIQIFTTALAILEYHEHALLGGGFSECIRILTTVPKNFQEERFFSDDGPLVHMFRLLPCDTLSRWISMGRMAEEKTHLYTVFLHDDPTLNSYGSANSTLSPTGYRRSFSTFRTASRDRSGDGGTGSVPASKRNNRRDGGGKASI
jgi:hypothetical protein